MQYIFGILEVYWSTLGSFCLWSLKFYQKRSQPTVVGFYPESYMNWPKASSKFCLHMIAIVSTYINWNRGNICNQKFIAVLGIYVTTRKITWFRSSSPISFCILMNGESKIQFFPPNIHQINEVSFKFAIQTNMITMWNIDIRTPWQCFCP